MIAAGAGAAAAVTGVVACAAAGSAAAAVAVDCTEADTLEMLPAAGEAAIAADTLLAVAVAVAVAAAAEGDSDLLAVVDATALWPAAAGA